MPDCLLSFLPGCRGFADSKTLSEEKRDRLFDVIQREAAAGEGGCLGHAADVLSAATISGEGAGGRWAGPGRTLQAAAFCSGGQPELACGCRLQMPPLGGACAQRSLRSMLLNHYFSFPCGPPQARCWGASAPR